MSRHSSFFILASSIRFKVFARNLIFRRRRELQPEQPLHHRGDSGKLPKREHGLDVRLQHDAELKQIGLSFHIFIFYCRLKDSVTRWLDYFLNICPFT